MNKIGENILLILTGVVAFGHSYTPELQDRTLREFLRELSMRQASPLWDENG